jgi:hypothetical protein
MKKITFQSENDKAVEFFYLDELADLIAYARHPEVDQDPDSMGYALAKIKAEDELTKAAKAGALELRNPLTHGPFDMILGVSHGVVLWDEASRVLAGYNVELQTVHSTTKQTPTKTESNINQPDNSLTTAQIARVFDGWPYKTENWIKRASDTKWVQAALVAAGSQGGGASLWNPLLLAQRICERESGPSKQRTLWALNSRFKSKTVLEPWRNDWDEYFHLFNDAEESR